jgi:hypothetical protein
VSESPADREAGSPLEVEGDRIEQDDPGRPVEDSPVDERPEGAPLDAGRAPVGGDDRRPDHALTAAAPAPLDPDDIDDLFPGLPETTNLEERSPALRLARIHLRNGAQLLARAELESLEGEGRLDRTGLLDLAECCWRTGDLDAAASPIERYLAAGGRDPLGFVIAAEGAAARGRPTEARRFAGRARAAADLDLEFIFAGAPRSDVWPSSGTTLEETLFRLPALPESLQGSPPVAGSSQVAPGVTGTSPDGARDGGSPPQATDLPEAGSRGADEGPNGVEQPGFWDGTETGPDGPAGAELATARAFLDAEDETAAALSFGVALRLDPAQAGPILRLTAAASGPAIMLVRGDAYRALGDEQRARSAYAAAAMRPPRGADSGTLGRAAGSASGSASGAPQTDREAPKPSGPDRPADAPLADGPEPGPAAAVGHPADPVESPPEEYP